MKIEKKHITRFLRIKFRYILYAFLLIACILLSIAEISNQLQKNNAGSFDARIEDQAITLQWKIPAKQAVLSITGPSIEYEETVESIGQYRFTKGKHSEVYAFELTYIDHKGKQIKKQLERIFLDFNQLPNLTTIVIETLDHKDLEYKYIHKPQIYIGETITKNYKRATFNNIPIKIRVRGNTSTLLPKKSYKIHFKKRMDLMNLGDEYADRDWYLLAGGDNLKTYFALQVAAVLKIGWEPRMRFVNLILNGNWMGVYMLSESIKAHPKRCRISKTGYLIEHDPYFWSMKGLYFKSTLLDKNLGFTFKYPEITSPYDPQFLAVKDQIKSFEKLLKQNSPEMYNFIDIDTFALWGLAHEIMGTWDSAGSNIYFYKYSVNKKHKLKMGPLWDFDTLFQMKDHEHSRIYSEKMSYFTFLLRNPMFRNVYKQKYLSISKSLEEKMRIRLDTVQNIPGLEKSRELDSKIWKNKYIPIRSEIENLMLHLHRRIIFLDDEISRL